MKWTRSLNITRGALPRTNAFTKSPNASRTCEHCVRWLREYSRDAACSKSRAGRVGGRRFSLAARARLWRQTSTRRCLRLPGPSTCPKERFHSNAVTLFTLMKQKEGSTRLWRLFGGHISNAMSWSDSSAFFTRGFDREVVWCSSTTFMSRAAALQYSAVMQMVTPTSFDNSMMAQQPKF